MDFADEVKRLAALARERNPHPQDFGTIKHGFKFNPVIGIERIREFEAQCGLTLPGGYVEYLTRIGNGGAGPGYGLFPLEMVKGFYNPDWEIFLDKADKTAEWEELCRALDDGDEEYSRIEGRVLNGSVIIGTPGCTMYTVLMCKGENYGKICVVDLDMVEEYEPRISEKTFEEWILGYFRKAAGI